MAFADRHTDTSMSAALPDQICAELNRRWSTRRSPQLDALYDNRREASQRQRARIAAHLAAFAYLLFSLTDVILLPDVAATSIVARVVISSLFAVGTELQYRLGAGMLFMECHCAAAIVIAYATWLLIANTSEYELIRSYYTTYSVIFMIGQNVFFNFRPSVAAISSTAILVISLANIFAGHNQNLSYIVAVGVLQISTYVITLYVNLSLNDERYRVFLNAIFAEHRQAEALERGAALLRLSTTDALTGLVNRRAIDEELRSYWKAWCADSAGFAVILIDVDYFKRYNDQYGHQEGDRCLKAIACAMEGAVENLACSIGRFGGEEFILLAPSQSRAQVAAIAESIRCAVEDLQMPHEQRPDDAYVVTVSIGVALSQDVLGTKAERLVTEADRALYNAKRSSRNCVKIYDRGEPNQLDLDESIAELLRTALAAKRVSLVYQPIYNITSRRIEAVEALMRLTGSDGKSVAPDVFIPIAERMGLILPLGLWAIRTACEELLTDGHVPKVSVNVSVVQLQSPGFGLAVAAILAEANVSPRRLVLEITEGLKIEGKTEAIKSIRELHSMGVEVWLDDFGTGFAGLSCIREITFDAVKIDRSFLHASSAPRGAQMLKNIVDLVRGTGCETIIEGVETPEQLLVAAKEGVDYAQGYHLNRPMPAEGIRALSPWGKEALKA